MRQTQKIAVISMFAVLLLFVTPGISFAQSVPADTVKDNERDATRDEVRDQIRDEVRDQVKDSVRDEVRDQVRDEVREQRIQDARDRLAEKREQLKRDREAQVDAQREKLEKEVISDFIDKPYNPDPACPDWDLQLVNPEVDGITDTKILKCYAKHLKAENDMLKNALVKIWDLMHRLANAYGVVG